MTFESDKKTALNKIDKSKKGSIDADIKELVDTINNSEKLYTTSSCAGRILIISIYSRKDRAEWLLASHSRTGIKEVLAAISDIPGSDTWLKQEPPILHVAAKDIEAAQDMVNMARSAGFKKSGIQSTRKKVMIEICSTEIMEAIIAEKGKIVVSEEYLRILVSHANKKLEDSRKKIGKLTENIKEKIEKLDT